MTKPIMADLIPNTAQKIKNKVIKRVNTRKVEVEKLRRARMAKSMEQILELIRHGMSANGILVIPDQSKILQMTNQYLREMTKLIDALNTVFNQRAAHSAIVQDTMEFFDANPQYEKTIRDSVIEKLDEQMQCMDREIAVLSAKIKSWNGTGRVNMNENEIPKEPNIVLEYWRPWQ